MGFFKLTKLKLISIMSFGWLGGFYSSTTSTHIHKILIEEFRSALPCHFYIEKNEETQKMLFT